jgi:hypothetical protein
MGNEKVWEFAILNGLHSQPADWSAIDIVPILTGYGAGVAACAPGLIKVESHLDH